MAHLLSEDCKIVVAITAANGVAGKTDINGATLDMNGFDAVLMLVRFGTITNNAVTKIYAQQGAASNLSDAATMALSTVAVGDTDSNKYFAIDVVKPRDRYVRLVVDRGTQNAVVEHAVYIQYKAKDRAPSDDGIENIAQLVQPIDS